MIVVGVIIVLGVIGSMLNGGDEQKKEEPAKAAAITKTTSETQNKQTNETKQSTFGENL